jgi:hypothetical protein
MIGAMELTPVAFTTIRRAIYAEVWDHIGRFTKLARADLRVGEEDAFAALTPVTGDRLKFERPLVARNGSPKEP